MNPVDLFISAVQALNGAPGDSQREADKWLSEFKYSREAWPVLVGILKCDISHDALFHAANILLSKTKNDWKKLGPDDKDQLLGLVRCDHLPSSAFLAEDDIVEAETVLKILIMILGVAQTAIPSFVFERLCMAQATMTCMSGQTATSELLQSCQNMLVPGVDSSLSYVQAIMFSLDRC
jgi:hypothetical protein